MYKQLIPCINNRGGSTSAKVQAKSRFGTNQWWFTTQPLNTTMSCG